MNLEDHLGDVIRKARRHAGVPPQAVARAAGISPRALEDWEQSGACPAGVDFEALGRALGLAGARLAALAAGWHPRPRDLAAWGGLRQFATTADGNTVNCFLAWDEPSRQAALFDTGWEAAPVAAFIRERGLDLRHLFVTHAHEDHVAALEPLRRAFPAAAVQGGAALDGREWAVGSLRVRARAVPGHAEDGLVFVLTGWPGQAPPVVMAGDTLFAGSVARGFVSSAALLEAIRQVLLRLPPATLVCPGHGPVTTVGEEMEHNPFF